ncbi:MAG: preprotein translocase subunit YajC [Bacteroidia bacterium]|nr:preprotein translocase subunit YajC [Bacteroidia bacterium]MDW8346590.1 preprotein translocase subunit YajC [Bacteroidia bacterium]
MLNLMLLFGGASQSGQQNGANNFSGLIMLLLVFVVMYFFMIRPQLKKQKEAQKFRNELKKGDKVITIGGLHGKIIEVTDNTVVLEADKDIHLTFEKSAIASLANTQSEKKA